jgi:hypothetical protein
MNRAATLIIGAATAVLPAGCGQATGPFVAGSGDAPLTCMQHQKNAPGGSATKSTVYRLEVLRYYTANGARSLLRRKEADLPGPGLGPGVCETRRETGVRTGHSRQALRTIAARRHFRRSESNQRHVHKPVTVPADMLAGGDRRRRPWAFCRTTPIMSVGDRTILTACITVRKKARATSSGTAG